MKREPSKTNLTPIKVTMLALMLALAAGAIALAQEPGQSSGDDEAEFTDGSFGPRFEVLTRRLDLTTEQQAAIATLRQEERQKSFELHKQIMRLRNELEGEMLADEPQEKTVVALTEQIGQLRTELQVEKLRTKLAISQELTAEQRDKMLMQKMSRRGAGERGHRKGAGRWGWRHGGGGSCQGPHGDCDAECDGEGPKGPHGRGGRDRDR